MGVAGAGVMLARAPDAVLDELLALLPPSEDLARDRDSNLARVLAGPAGAIGDAEARAVAFGLEMQPGSALALLADYERVLGPDPCGRDLLALSVGDRQALAASRWTGRGGQSPQYFIDLAASLGTAITITEGSLFVAGVSEAGDVLAVEGDQFAWQVSLPGSRVVDFIAGSAEAGDALGAFDPNLCECVIRLQAPAHTTPVFDYQWISQSFDFWSGVPAGFNFSRASPAWYFDATGTLTQAANDVARQDHDPVSLAALGTLIEGLGVNQIRNPRAEGGGTPTYWYIAATNGLSASVVGTGSEDGIPYIDIRWTGTTTNTSSPFVRFGTTTEAAAATGQTWTASVFARLVAGAIGSPMIAPYLQLVEATSSGGTVTSQKFTIAPDGSPLREQRFATTRTLSGGATVAATYALAAMTYAAGTAVDFTWRIGCPQLEQAADASSPIMPPAGSPAASTRASDALTLALPVGEFPGAAAWSVALDCALAGLPGNKAIIGIGTARFEDTAYLLASGADTAEAVKLVGGAGAASGNFGALGIGTALSLALALDAGDARACLNGGAVAVAAQAGFTAPTRIMLGNLTNGVGVAQPMWLRRLRLWPSKLDDTDLQAVTGP